MASLSVKGQLEGKNSLLAFIGGLRNERKDLILVHNFHSAAALIPVMVFSGAILYILKLWMLYKNIYG